MLRVLASSIALVGALMGADGHAFACLDNADNTGGALSLVAADGSVTWTHPIKGGRDLWVLPNGNILYSTGHGAEEVTPDHKVVFALDLKKNEVHSCQRLADGNTLIGECRPEGPRLIEVKPDGSIAHEIPLVSKTKNPHDQMRMVRSTADGTYLVAHNGDRMVREYDPSGKVVAELEVPVQVHAIVRLPGKGLLISGNNGPDGPATIEYDGHGKEVWRVGAKDLPGITFKWMSGLQRLPNGNTVICQWLGHKQLGTGPQLVEVTRDKQVVWTCADHQRFKTISAMQFLDVPGDVLKGGVLR